MTEQTATAAAQEYSPWLGPITPSQFQAALERFNLGDFVKAAAVREGLYRQNVFLSSTTGDYVLRGRPVFSSQFPKECFGAALLRERSRIPVAHPYLLDSSTDIFGWPYIIMPRLPGVGGCDERLSVGEQVWVTRAIAQNLVEMQDLTWPFAGEYNAGSNRIEPFVGGYADWVLNETRRWLQIAQEQAFITSEDVDWVEELIKDSKSAFAMPFRPCFVMGDYHPANVLVACEDGEWRVSGAFDFTDFYFGDRESDLVRAVGVYLDVANHEDTRLARLFGTAYLEARPPGPGFIERYTLSMVRDRVRIWELGKRTNLHLFFPEGRPFREYAERYIASYRLFEHFVK